MSTTRFILWLVLSAIGAAGQPVVSANGVLNSANYLPACAVNGGIARGSIFVVFGSGLGSADLRQVDAFPLRPSLAGTSIRVTVGGSSVDALPIYVSATQVAVLLPSTTPIGTGTLTVSYADRTSI